VRLSFSPDGREKSPPTRTVLFVGSRYTCYTSHPYFHPMVRLGMSRATYQLHVCLLFMEKGLKILLFDGSLAVQIQLLLGETLALIIVCPMPSHTRQRLPLYQVQCRAQNDTLFYSVFSWFSPSSCCLLAAFEKWKIFSEKLIRNRRLTVTKIIWSPKVNNN